MGDKQIAYILHCSVVPDEFYKDAIRESVVSTGFLDLFPQFFNMDPNAKMTEGLTCENLYEKYNRVPWGVSTEDFLLPMTDRNKLLEKKDFLIYTWGCAADPDEEYIETIYMAVRDVDGKMLHSGVDYQFDEGINYHYVPPAQYKWEIAGRYNQCWFANAMRSVDDGFELANVEAPLSNCIPITLDKPCFTHWFKGPGCSLFIGPSHEKVYQDLVGIFNVFNKDQIGYFEEFISPTNKQKIVNEFNWRRTVRPFWKPIVDHFYSKELV